MIETQRAQRPARPRRCARLLPALVLGALLVSGSARAGQAPTGKRPEAAPVLVEIVSAVQPAPAEASLIEIGEDGRAEAAEWLPATVRLERGAARLRLVPPDSAGHPIQARAPGVWSAPILLGKGAGRELAEEAQRAPDGEPETVHRLVLWPAAELAAEIVLPEVQDKLPESQEASAATVDLRLSPEPGAEGVRADQPPGVVEITCPVEEGKLAACTVPAGRWNLRLTRAPFAPHFIWNLEIAGGHSVDLGRVGLRRGGSVFGRVTTEEGPIDPERARVTIRPVAGDRSLDPAEKKRFRQLGRTLPPRPDGNFEIVGVPAGEYEVLASQPGFVTARRAPVSVQAGRWTEIAEPLVLELPLRLSVEIEPAKAPAGDLWTLSLYRVDEDGEMLSHVGGTADDAGLWTSPPTPAGPYRLEIRDGQDNAVRWEDVELSQGSQVVRVEIPLVAVEGEVTLGDEPLEATVWFGGRHGEEQVQVPTDEQGELFAVLPHDGTWPVDVQAEEPRVRSRGLEVEIERRDDGEPSEVHIEVPSTLLTGRVVDQAGRPPSQPARIFLMRIDGAKGSDGWLAAPDGRFEIRGVRSGSYMVSAETEQASSEAVRVELGDVPAPPLVLTLGSRTHLSGRVTSATGPVPGAQVRALPFAQPGSVPGGTIETALTTVDGTFDLTIPMETRSVQMTVDAPGYAIAIVRTADLEEPEIALGHEAGTLRLEGLQGLFVPGDDLRVGLVLADGQPLGLNDLSDWADEGARDPLSERTTLTVPRMPPGTYTLCALAYDEAVLVVTGAAYPSGNACTQGFLPAGGELTLQAP